MMSYKTLQVSLQLFIECLKESFENFHPSQPILKVLRSKSANGRIISRIQVGCQHNSNLTPKELHSIHNLLNSVSKLAHLCDIPYTYKVSLDQLSTQHLDKSHYHSLPDMTRKRQGRDHSFTHYRTPHLSDQ